jgi:hypothetical protein
MLPDIYFNSDVGPADNFELGMQCVINTAIALRGLKEEIGNGHILYSIEIKSFPIANETGTPKYIQDIFNTVSKNYPHKEHIDYLKYLLVKFSSGKIEINSPAVLTLEGLEASSPVLEHALNENAMALSFATDGYWKKHFIKFTNSEKKLPNIWGQEDFTEIKEWLRSWHDTQSAFTENLKRKFNTIFCGNVESNFAFAQDEQTSIINALNSAQRIGYECGQIAELRAWQGEETIFGKLKELRVLGKGIRIFFINKDNGIIIGGCCRKGRGQTTKLQKKEANKAIKKINQIKNLN